MREINHAHWLEFPFSFGEKRLAHQHLFDTPSEPTPPEPDEKPAKEKTLDDWKKLVKKAFENPSDDLRKLVVDGVLNDAKLSAEELKQIDLAVRGQLADLENVDFSEDVPDELLAENSVVRLGIANDLITHDAYVNAVEKNRGKPSSTDYRGLMFLEDGRIMYQGEEGAEEITIDQVANLADKESDIENLHEAIDSLRTRNMELRKRRAQLKDKHKNLNPRIGWHANKLRERDAEIAEITREIDNILPTLNKLRHEMKTRERFSRNSKDMDYFEQKRERRERESKRLKAISSEWKEFLAWKKGAEGARGPKGSDGALYESRKQGVHYLGNITRSGYRATAIQEVRDYLGLDKERPQGTDSYRMFLANQRASGYDEAHPRVINSTAAHNYQKGIERHWDVKKSGLGPDDPYRGLSFSPYKTREEMEEWLRMSRKQQKKYAHIHEGRLREAYEWLTEDDVYKNIEGAEYLIADIKHVLDNKIYQEYPPLFSRFNQIYREIALSRSAAPEIKPNEHGEIEPPKNSLGDITIDLRDTHGVFDSLKITRKSDGKFFVLAPDKPNLGMDSDQARIYKDMGTEFSIERSKRLKFGKHKALSVTFYATKPGLYEIQKGVTGVEKYTLDVRSASQLVDANETLRITSLNKEEAELLVEKIGEKPLILDRLKKLDAGVAQTLALKFEGPSISLNGLTEIPPGEAMYLGLIKAQFLSLDGLKSVDENTIKWLGTFDGTISLNGLRTLPDNSNKNETFLTDITSLSLNELRSTSNIAAEIEASGIGSLKSVSLDKVRTISEKDARMLSKVPSVSLKGLRKDTLAKKTIAVLLFDYEKVELPADLESKEAVQDAINGIVELEGEKRAKRAVEYAHDISAQVLELQNLVNIDQEASEQIAEFVGDIRCDKLEVINDKAIASNLVANKEKAFFNGCTTLTKEAAEGLVSNPRLKELSLDKLTSEDKDVLSIIASFRGSTILLKSLTKLTDESIDALSKYKGVIYLNGVKRIESDKLDVLASNVTGLYLNGLESITLQQAEKLANKLGRGDLKQVNLDGLKYNGGTEEEMKILSALLEKAHGDITTSLKGLRDPSEDLISLLEKHKDKIKTSEQVENLLQTRPKPSNQPQPSPNKPNQPPQIVQGARRKQQPQMKPPSQQKAPAPGRFPNPAQNINLPPPARINLPNQMNMPGRETLEEVDNLEEDRFLRLLAQDKNINSVKNDDILKRHIRNVKLKLVDNRIIERIIPKDLAQNMAEARKRYANLRAMIARNLAFKNKPVTPENIQEECLNIIEQREVLRKITLFQGRNVLYTVHNEKLYSNYAHGDKDRFGKKANRNAISKQQKSGKGSLEFIRPGQDLDSVRKAREKILDSMVKKGPPFTFYFEGHGLADKIELNSSVSISVDDLAEVFKKRHQKYEQLRTGKPEQADIVIFGCCHNAEIARNIKSKLGKDVPGPIFLTESEYGLYGYSDKENKFTDDFSELSLGLGHRDENNPSTLGTVFEHEFDDKMETNPSVYIPFKGQNSQNLFQQITRIDPSGPGSDPNVAGLA